MNHFLFQLHIPCLFVLKNLLLLHYRLCPRQQPRQSHLLHFPLHYYQSQNHQHRQLLHPQRHPLQSASQKYLLHVR